MDNCPSDLCECDDDDNTEQIDYDPIQRANEPTPVAEPAQSPEGAAREVQAYS